MEVRGYNLFAYCMNNSVNMSDSSGQWALSAIIKTVIVVTAMTVVDIMMKKMFLKRIVRTIQKLMKIQLRALKIK